MTPTRESETPMGTQEHHITLAATDTAGFDISVTTPRGEFNLRGSISPKDGALVLFVDTDGTHDLEPTPDVLRVNVNDGPVFNYRDAVNWYGEDTGTGAP